MSQQSRIVDIHGVKGELLEYLEAMGLDIFSWEGGHKHTPYTVINIILGIVHKAQDEQCERLVEQWEYQIRAKDITCVALAEQSRFAANRV